MQIALKRTASFKEDTSDTSASQEKPVQKTRPGQYDLAYILSRQSEEKREKAGDVKVYHDVSLKKWRLTVQLDQVRLYFLSVFIKEDGTFDKYCLDYEAAHDSHYEFTDDTMIRKKLHEPGDESKYLHEILIRYVEKKGTGGLIDLIGPSITAQFHYD